MQVWLGLCGLLVLCNTAVAAAEKPLSLALVIGNAAYRAIPALPACEASANFAAAALGRAGFTVTKVLNPSNAQMGQALVTFGDAAAAAPGSRTVVYLCGYASGFADRPFLLPVDAQIERPPDVLSQGIVARLLVTSALPSSAAAGLALIDYATPPGSPEAALGTLLRPAERAHAGLAAAMLPGRPTLAGPLAAALPDMLRERPLDLGQALRRLAAQPEFAQAGRLAVQLPNDPSTLLDGVDAPQDARTAAASPSTAARPRTAKDRR